MNQSALPPYQLIFEKSRMGMLILDEHCLIMEANEAISQLTGWARADLVGRTACGDLLRAGVEGSGACAAICHDQLRSMRAEPGEARRLLLRTRGGSEVPVRASASPVPLADGGSGSVLFVWDVSQAERTERELDKSRRRAEELVAIGREVAAAADIRHQMEPVLNRARRLLGVDLVAWGALDPQTECLTWEAAEGPGAYRLRGGHMNLGGSLMGQILLQGRTYVTMNLSAEQARYPSIHRFFSQPTFTTALIVSQAVGDGRQGALLCASRRRIALEEEDVMLATHLGSYLATAVEKALLLEEVRGLAVLQERQRLAAEMHDGFGQNLTYLGLRLHLIGRYAERGDLAAIAREVASLKQVLQEAHQEVRNAIYALKASAPSPDPLSLRWQRMLADFADRSGIQVDYQAEPGATEFIPQVVQSQLTRILQEALANVRNHSGACRVTIAVSRVDGELRVVIDDDGCGFEVGKVRGVEQRHFGLTLMAERAAAIGAALEIRSQRGHGTTVSVRWSYRSGAVCSEPVQDSDSAGR